jgi:large subunit ribosomal protein L25
MKYSFTKLNCYLNCPLQFKYRYIDKQAVQIEGNTALRLGYITHKLLEYTIKTNDYASALNSVLVESPDYADVMYEATQISKRFINHKIFKNDMNYQIETEKYFELNIDGTKSQAIVKELQFSPTTDRIMHIDFQQLVPGKKVKTEVPLITKGFSKGQQAGGKLEVKQRKIKIKADADKIPTSITIDVTPLELGKSLRIRDIITEGYEILNPTSLPIVSITIPRALRSQQAAAAAGKK